MRIKKLLTKNIASKAGNVLFFGLLLLLLFSPGAKAWVLKQLLGVGLFRAEIKKEAAAPLPATAGWLFRNENGQTISAADLNGKVVFINFWATWCPPCRAEMPSLHQLYNRYKGDSRIVFLFVSEDNDPATAKQYLKKEGYAMPLATRGSNLPENIYNGTLPTTVVLDKEGKVVLRHEGLAAYNTGRFIRQLESLF